MPVSENWRMIVALPGVDLKESVDGGDLAAIGSSDPRYTQIRETQPGAKEYLSKFKTPFGVQLEPSIIAAPEKARIYDYWISEFRSIVAVPHVIRARMDYFASGGGFGSGPPYTDLFDFYPFGLGKDGRQITLLAAAEWGTGFDLSRFEGGYPSTVTSSPQDFKPVNDDLLSDALLKVWRSKPTDSAEQEFRARVFRSLFMADYALRAFYANIGSILDAAIPLALFTSAFEPLTAPPAGDVSARDVVALVQQVPWERDELRENRYRPIHYDPKPGDPPVTLPGQVYGRLHQLRNRLLHGKHLKELEPNRERDWGDLKVQVPALYRSTLLHVLSACGFGKFETDGWCHDPYEDALLNEKRS